MKGDRADVLGMDAARGNRRLDDGGSPRLLDHYAAFERMVGAQGCSARQRLDVAIGGELASLLCRALTRGPRSPVLALAV